MSIENSRLSGVVRELQSIGSFLVSLSNGRILQCVELRSTPILTPLIVRARYFLTTGGRSWSKLTGIILVSPIPSGGPCEMFNGAPSADRVMSQEMRAEWLVRSAAKNLSRVTTIKQMERSIVNIATAQPVISFNPLGSFWSLATDWKRMIQAILMRSNNEHHHNTP